MVDDGNNGVVVLMGFSDKKMSELLSGPQKNGRNNGVVIWWGSIVTILDKFKMADPRWRTQDGGYFNINDGIVTSLLLLMTTNLL